MSTIFVIGGTGVERFLPAGAEPAGLSDTPFGPPSAEPMRWEEGGTTMLFLSRHGPAGETLPQDVNYRANVWLAREYSPELVIGVNAVGGIAAEARPGRLVVPDQLIDYTWGREQTCVREMPEVERHVDFTDPFAPAAREILTDRIGALSLDAVPGGTYGATQGPRLESAAEIDRLERDGCTIVGMTGMPEAGIARELGLEYAICAVVINWAAGRGRRGETIHDGMGRHLDDGMAQVRRLIDDLASASPAR